MFYLSQEFCSVVPGPIRGHLANDKIVHNICKPWCMSLGDVHKLFIRERLSNGHNIFSEVYSQPGQMVCYHILRTLFIPNLNVKFLQQQDPPDETRFSIFLGQEILQSSMIRVDQYFRP